MTLEDSIRQNIDVPGRVITKIRDKAGLRSHGAIRKFLRRAIELAEAELDSQGESGPKSEPLVQGRAKLQLHFGQDLINLAITEEEISWAQKLLTVLRSGNKDAFRAVTENLNVFEKFVKLDADTDAAISPEAGLGSNPRSSGTKRTGGPHQGSPGHAPAEGSHPRRQDRKKSGTK